MGFLDRLAGNAVVLPRTEAECWVAPGQAVEIAGRSIGGGLFYLGSGLEPLADAYWLESEPALVDPTLPVTANPARHQLSDFALSYATITPADRGAYLQWLAGPRHLVEADPFFDLYFAGLERRLFVGLQIAEDPAAEWNAIVGELRRLDSEATEEDGRHHHLVGRLLSYLDSVSVMKGGGEVEPPREKTGWHTPLTLLLQFGRFAREGTLLPSEWAVSWALTSSESYLRTPAQRCPEQFERLFAIRYRERFDEGLRLPTDGPPIELEYRTANYGLPDLSDSTDLPNPAESASVVEALRELALSCCAELDPYSRWIGRNPEGEGSFKAAALLPACLLKDVESSELTAIKDFLSRESSGEQPWAFESDELIDLWSPGAEKLPKKDAVALAQLVEKLDFGLEPDPRFGGPSLAPGSIAVLFPSREGDPRSPSPAYGAASLVLHLLAAVAAADGSVSPQEEEHLERHMEEVAGLFEGERARLRAHTQWLIRSKPKFAGLKKKLDPLDADQRGALAERVVVLAASDGDIAPEEVKMLGKIFKLLGLDPESVYSELHAVSAGAAEWGPVVVRPGTQAPPGHPIPREKRGLDRATVEEKIEETALVSSLLANIFEEEEPVGAEPAEPTVDAANGAGLDPAHLDFARELSSRDSWSRIEVETLADQRSLLVDGALETVNEAAFEKCDAPLAEGNDPIEIDLDVAKEMLQ